MAVGDGIDESSGWIVQHDAGMGAFRHGEPDGGCALERIGEVTQCKRIDTPGIVHADGGRFENGQDRVRVVQDAFRIFDAEPVLQGAGVHRTEIVLHGHVFRAVHGLRDVRIGTDDARDDFFSKNKQRRTGQACR